jgi:putrescine transport system substrate-binding protein
MPSRFPLVARAGSVIWQFVLLLTCVVPLLCAHAEAPTLRIFGWGDYIDQRALDKFTGETGIQVQYDIYNSLSELEATVALARSGYDIIMPTNEPTLSRLVRGDRLARIDRAKVPNWKNLDPALMRMVATADPGNKHGAIYLWGTLGLGMLPDKVRALVPDVPLDSLDLLFKPENAQRLQSCGITILDSPPEVIPTVLHYLGLSPLSTSATDLAAVERTLMGIRPYIRTFSATSALETLANGSTCLALAFSGNVLQAVVRAKAANRGVNVAYYAPRGGAQASFDVLAIPIDAPNKDAATAFINFMLRPEIIADISNVTRYANAVPASHPMIDPALLNDPNAFPTDKEMVTSYTPGPVTLAPKMARNQLWKRFKEAR